MVFQVDELAPNRRDECDNCVPEEMTVTLWCLKIVDVTVVVVTVGSAISLDATGTELARTTATAECVSASEEVECVVSGVLEVETLGVL